MARLMNVPIEGRGDSVLIIASHADTALIGFVTQAELRSFFPICPSMCECMSFVSDNLLTIEQILLRKSRQNMSCVGSIACTEVTAADILQMDRAGGNRLAFVRN